MKKIILLSFIFSLLFLTTSTISAATQTNPESVPSTSGTVKLTNPLTGKTTYDETKEGIPILLGKIISSVLGVVGSLALVMFIYGGITWMLSAGNQEQVTKGKNILIWAALGIIIIFTSYALVKFVLTTVTMTNP
ncbi:MAG: pilin [bacterium]|nr:pilin [bacterium]